MKKILIIEDDVSLRENTAEILELSGYDVVMAANGKLGVDKAKKELPDIIVCDIMMPEMDGYGVLEVLSNTETTKNIPFIFLSAKTEHTEIRKGMNLGADDYLTKPYEEQELLSALASRLAKAELLRNMSAKNGQASKRPKAQIQSLDELKKFFTEKGTVENFEKNIEIYEEGIRANSVYLVLKGIVKCHKMDADGKELITGIYSPNDFLGFTSFAENIPHKETATVVEDARLAEIPKDTIKELLQQNQELALELVALLNENIIDIKEQLLQMAYSSVRRKTARTLLQFSDILNKNTHEPIHISRTDLSSVAGIATESLIRTLTSFRKEGLIAIEGRNIRILKLDLLQKIV